MLAVEQLTRGRVVGRERKLSVDKQTEGKQRKTNWTNYLNLVVASHRCGQSSTKGLADVKAKTNRNTKELNGLLGVVAEKDQAQQKNIQRIENVLVDLRKERTRSATDISNHVREQIAKEMEKTRAVGASAALQSATSEQDDKEKKYWIAWRTLRCWPVAGATTKEMWQGADLFFCETMDLPLNAAAERDIEHIQSAMPGSRRARVQNEIIVIFKEVCVQDYVAPTAIKHLKLIWTAALVMGQ